MKKNYKIINIVFAIVTSAFLVGCSSRSGPPASVHYDKAVSPYHVVKKGDSIASIAKKYDMNKRELIRINGLESPYRIVKGQRLLVRAHKIKSKNHDEMDESEMPATEEVGEVPEEGEVQVKKLKPIPGTFGESSGLAKGVESGGRMNPEVEDEADAEAVNEAEDGPGSTPGSPSKRKFDEDNIDEAEEQNKRHKVDSTPAASSLPHADASSTWPVQGAVTRNFNPTGKGKAQNDGINIVADKGTTVVAANNGVVAHAGKRLKGFGNVVLIKHAGNIVTVYAHLDKVLVKKGDTVKAGQKIGTTGETGIVDQPQLHFQVRQGGKPINPAKYLPKS